MKRPSVRNSARSGASSAPSFGALAGVLVWVLFTAGCGGSKGDSGKDGINGADGANGAAGAVGANGAIGAAGAQGVAGADGAGGANGSAGENGANGTSCTVTQTSPTIKTITCEDGTTATVVDGTPGVPGTSVATVTLHIVDADSNADLAGADLLVTPGDISGTTDASGRATFADLPFGLYQFSATAPGLRVVAGVVGEFSVHTVTTTPLSLAAGAVMDLRVEVPRLDTEMINMQAVHTAGNVAFTATNCEACHGDRANEKSADPAKPPWHALPVHNGLTCTQMCHTTTIDLLQDSGASLRKQVAVSVCKGCHTHYPASFAIP